MQDWERRAEYLGQLFEAVCAGDGARAGRVLDEMHACGVMSEEIRSARRRANPSLISETTIWTEQFPKPGHLPGSYLGSPKFETASA